MINEVDYVQPGPDDAEFVEIMNIGTVSVNLGTYDLVLVNGAGGGAVIYDMIDLPAVPLAPGGFFVICGNAASVPNCDLEYGPSVDFIQDGDPDAVALVFDDGSAASTDSERLATVVDTVSYGGNTGAPYTEGSGAGLVDDPSVDAVSISRFPNGQDTDSNAVDFSQRCISPGRINRAPSVGCDAIAVPVGGFEVGDLQIAAEAEDRARSTGRDGLAETLAILAVAVLASGIAFGLLCRDKVASRS